MRDPRIHVIARDVGELLECPRWHPDRRRISFVDIPTGRVFEVAPGSDDVMEYETGITPLGAALPIAHGYLLVGSDRIWQWSPGIRSSRMSAWGRIRPHSGIVSNDAILHHGAVWVGRLDAAETPGAGSVWRVTPDAADEIISGLTLPNGLVPTADGRGMLLAESVHQRIYRFNLDLAPGDHVGLGVFRELPGWTPDGLARDPWGNLWVARWGEGKVTRLESGAKPLLDAVVPTPQSTAAAFDPQGVLYVTTARENWTAEQRLADPLAGSIFRVGVSATAIP